MDDGVRFDPWSAAFVADPYPAYRELRGQGRALWCEATGQWLIPHYADVSALLRDRRLARTYLHRFGHEEFGQVAPPPQHEPFHVLNGHGLLDLEEPDHGRVRRLVAKAFTRGPWSGSRRPCTGWPGNWPGGCSRTAAGTC